MVLFCFAYDKKQRLVAFSNSLIDLEIEDCTVCVPS